MRSPDHRARCPRSILLSLLVLVTLLAGCGQTETKGSSSESADASPTPEGTSSSAHKGASPTTTPSGSSSSGAASSGSPSSKPTARTAQVRGTGYSFVLPRGWADRTARMQREQKNLDVAVGATVQRNAFTNNLTVVLAPAGTAGEEQLGTIARQVKKSLAKSAPRYAIRPATKVDGLPAAHLSGLHTGGASPYWLEQYIVLGPSNAQVISFSLDRAMKPAARTALIRGVLGSWRVER